MNVSSIQIMPPQQKEPQADVHGIVFLRRLQMLLAENIIPFRLINNVTVQKGVQVFFALNHLLCAKTYASSKVFRFHCAILFFVVFDARNLKRYNACYTTRVLFL